MPIRINLFAESQAAEELRRKDPVKRAIWVGVCIIVLVLVWSSSLQVKIMTENGQLSSLQGSLNNKTNEYEQVLSYQTKVVEMRSKLAALNKLAASRFLEATLMDTFQHSPVDGIQISRMRTEQNYDVVPDGPPAKLDGGKVMPGKAGFSTERIRLYLDACDGSSSPGIIQVNKFRDIISQTHYFANEGITSNHITLKSITPPTFNTETQKPFVLFSLECIFPDRIH